MRFEKMAAVAALVLAGSSVAGGIAYADPEPEPPAPPPAEAQTTINGDGVYQVGVDIAPGTYASAGPANGTCSWKRSGAGNETIDNAITKKPQVVSIAPTDATFKTSGCQTWSLTDAAPPAAVGNLQAQAAMALLNGLMGGGGAAASAPSPAAQAPTGPPPGPAEEPSP